MEILDTWSSEIERDFVDFKVQKFKKGKVNISFGDFRSIEDTDATF